MNVHVECYAGYREEETPRRFTIGSRRVEVVEVIDRWLAPDYRYFKVLGDDRTIYIFRYDLELGQWELIMYDQSSAV